MKNFYKVALISSFTTYAIIGQAAESNLIKNDTTTQNLSIGSNAQTNGGTYSTAIGDGSTTKGDSALSLGTQSHANGNNSVVIGALGNVTASSTTGIGAHVNVGGDSATAIGSNSVAKGESSVALGVQAKSMDDSSIAIGATTEAHGYESIALGNSAQASQEQSIAIGAETKTEVKDGIAIGNSSVVKRAQGVQGFNPLASRDNKIDEKAFHSTGAAVSIGKEGKIRQITHVSAGTEDTDAVNVAQLKSAIHLGLKFKGDQGGPVTNKLGSQVDIKGDNENITTKLKQSHAGATVIKVELKKDLHVNSLKAKDRIQVGNVNVDNSGVTIQNGPALTKNGLNNGGNIISNVADGKAPTDAVNRRQLEGLKQEMHHIQTGIDDKIHKVSKESRAGSASAVATALLPQPFSAGRSMIGASLGHYRDQQAIAIGASRISDNGKWIIKTAVSEDTQKNFGGGMSFGYQW